MGSTKLRTTFEPRARALTLLVAAATGCMLITPLGEYEEPSATGGTAGSGQGGSTSQGGSGAQGGSAGSGADGGAGGAAGAGAGTDTGGGAGTGAEGGGAGQGNCTTNDDCSGRVTGPARCRPSDGTCISLQTPDCPLVYGDATDDDAVFLGAFAKLDSQDPERSDGVYPLRLAVDEIDKIDVPNSSRTPGLNGAELVLNICNNSTQAHVAAAMAHLVDEVEAPALVAGLRPADLIGAFEEYPDVLYLSPLGRTTDVTAADDASDGETRLIWNLLGEPTDYARAYGQLLSLVEAYLRDHADRGARPLRLALLVETDDPSNAELGAMLEQTLKYNGNKPPLEQDPGNYAMRELRSDTNVVDLADYLFNDFVADIVVSAAGNEFTKQGGLLTTLDATWSAGDPPFYILSPYNIADLGATMDWIDSLVNASAPESDANRRFIGLSVAPPENPLPQERYEARLLEHFPPPNTPEPDTGNWYDATYYLAYAAYAAGLDEPLTGRRMVEGLGKLIDGTEYEVGPDYARNVFDKLDGGDSVALLGTLGPPDFAAEGYRHVNGSVFCFDLDTENRVTLRKDVLVSTATGFGFIPPWTQFPCFDGFR